MTETIEAETGKDRQPVQGSSLGVVALMLSLVGALGCFVVGLVGLVGMPEVIVGMPLTALCSLTGFVLGVTAFFRARAGTPRTGAIAATFLGGFVGALQGALVVGALVQFLPIHARVVPLVEVMVGAHERRDAAAMDAVLSADALKQTDGERVLAFFDEIERKAGPITGVRFGLATIPESARTIGGFSPRQDADPNALVLGKPIELVYGSDQSVLLGVWLDEGALRDDEEVLIDDLIAFLPTGELLILRSGGPAEAMTQQFNALVVTP